jgi:glycosyltransferase involved in cell wall biosynthesis
MKNIRILHFINSFGIGGAETQLLRTIPLMQRDGWEHLVVALRPPTTLQGAFIKQKIPTYLLLSNRSNPLTQLVKGMVVLIRLVRIERPAILHTTLFPANFIARLVGRLTGVPVVEHLVNILYDPLRLLDPQIKRYEFIAQYRLDQITSHYVQHFIAISQAVKESAVNKLRVSSGQVTPIPYGVFPEEWIAPDTRSAQNEQLVAIGRLIPLKGHHYLLEAMRKVIVTFPRVHLSIIGDGPLRPELEKMIRQLGLEEQVSLIGAKSSQEVRSLLWNACVFVFPSLSEGLGVALLEAMASGLASVASAIPSVKEIDAEGKAVLLATPGDPESLAEGICRLLASPQEREAMGKHAQDIVREYFDLRKLAPRWIEVYEQVLSS